MSPSPARCRTVTSTRPVQRAMRVVEAERLVALARRMGVDPNEAIRLAQRLTETARLDAVDVDMTERVLAASAPHGRRTRVVPRTPLRALARGLRQAVRRSAHSAGSKSVADHTRTTAALRTASTRAARTGVG